MAKPLQFPDSSEVSDSKPSVLRTNENMVKIYNRKHGIIATNLSEKIQKWIAREAKERGWKQVLFPLKYPSKTKIAGCVFVKR